jgi:membrane-associated phospholipid phosphatase
VDLPTVSFERKDRTRHFLVGAILGAVCFALFAAMVVSQGAIIAFDERLAHHVYHYTADHPPLAKWAQFITDLGDHPFLIYVATFSVLFWLYHRQWRSALIYALGQLLIFVIIHYLKHFFERKRPPFTDWTSYSFPSGHAFGSSAVYGLVIYLVMWHLVERRLRWLLVGLLVAFVLAIALTRMMLGVHYFSDVVAGMSLGFGYASLLAAISEWVIQRQTKRGSSPVTGQ